MENTRRTLWARAGRLVGSAARWRNHWRECVRRTRSPRRSFAALLLLAAVPALRAPAGDRVGNEGGVPQTAAIAASGRLEPKQRVLRVSGSAEALTLVRVVRELYVQEGSEVKSGEVVGVFDTYPSRQAAVARSAANLAFAELQLRRFEELHRARVVSTAERDEWRTRVALARAELEQAEADLELSRIRAPTQRRVLKIHAYPGERVTSAGVLELGDTNQMYAVAEVFEDDIGWVRVGQPALVSSRVLENPISGVVEQIGYKIGKLDVLADDPAAKTDARVVEVRIRLADSEPVVGLTNLRVDVRIEPVAPGVRNASTR